MNDSLSTINLDHLGNSASNVIGSSHVTLPTIPQAPSGTGIPVSIANIPVTLSSGLTTTIPMLFPLERPMVNNLTGVQNAQMGLDKSLTLDLTSLRQMSSGTLQLPVVSEIPSSSLLSSVNPSDLLTTSLTLIAATTTLTTSTAALPPINTNVINQQNILQGGNTSTVNVTTVPMSSISVFPNSSNLTVTTCNVLESLLQPTIQNQVPVGSGERSLEAVARQLEEELNEPIKTDFWCVTCEKAFPTVCNLHGVPTVVQDTPIESHARMTLPRDLALQPSNITTSGTGVFTRTAIQARTQFGPLQGKIVKKSDVESESDWTNMWEIFRDERSSHFIDARDENEANWMMFVKRARTSLEQNLVAHQCGGDIFFTSSKDIAEGEELLMWFAGNYAKLTGVTSKPEQSYKCCSCDRQFADLGALGRHTKYAHPDMSGRKWKCELCERAFTSSSKLQVHIMVHTKLKPHKCNYCEKTFTDPSNLRTHLTIHTGVKKHACSVCNKTFRQKAHLLSHMVTHTGEKKMKCQFCDKMFSRQSDVKQHMYMHTRDREVKCTECGKIFWRLQHLKKHMKSHTGERNFPCDRCSKAFFTKYHLNRHKKACKGRGSSQNTDVVRVVISEMPPNGGPTQNVVKTSKKQQRRQNTKTRASTLQFPTDLLGGAERNTLLDQGGVQLVDSNDLICNGNNNGGIVMPVPIVPNIVNTTGGLMPQVIIQGQQVTPVSEVEVQQQR
ncbi:PRDM4 [Branchiostoma lanceolatum]|uniref:PRDM4 protein n=1 Tax=Branchiostoma lanceolatum TaxID=7740 RepID=A0A8J9ZAL2_BRALA|nr:PRDM4 [Branchiostoma lanceolatum]